MASRRIPLFPLRVVLFPGKVLPLHIFEPRYKLMVRQALDDNEPFGVVLALENGIARIGCTAVVARMIKTYEDGRMDVLTVGATPFRISAVQEEKPYLEATVSLLADDPQPGTTPIDTELRALFEQCSQLVHGRAPRESTETADSTETVSLAYQLADELPLDLSALQELLEIRAEAERRRCLLGHLRQLLPQLSRIAQMRTRAAGNGHGLN